MFIIITYCIHKNLTMKTKLLTTTRKLLLLAFFLITQVGVAQTTSDEKLLKLVDSHIQSPITITKSANGDVFLQRNMSEILSSVNTTKKFNKKNELVSETHDEEDHDNRALYEFLNRPQPSVQTMEKYFAQAAIEFNVPVEILKAIGQVQSNWAQVSGSMYGSYGVMGLIENEKVKQITLATSLTKITDDAIINDAKANIRAAAALLAFYQKGQPKSDSLEDWYLATRELTGLTNEEMKTSLTNRFFNVIKNGSKTVTNWKEIINIEAKKVEIPAMATTNKTNKSTAVQATVDYPNAKPRFAACNFGVGRNGFSIDYYFIHYFATGTYEGVINFFGDCSRTSPTSANYVIRNSDGEISQVVSESDRAYSQGVTGAPQWNGASVSTEHEVLTTNLAMWDSEPMLVASANLAIDVCTRNNISRSRRVNNGDRAIYGHSDVKATDCPNLTTARWNGLMARIVGGVVIPTVAMPTLYSVTNYGTDGGIKATWKPNTETTLGGYRLYYATDDTLATWALAADETILTAATTSISLNKSEFKVVPTGDAFHFRLIAIVPNGTNPIVESVPSDVYSRSITTTGPKVLIVDGFDRSSGKYLFINHNFSTSYFKSLSSNATLQISTAANEKVEDGTILLSDYDTVVWFLGDESSANVVFSTNEKNKIKDYLENGGKLLLSGSEVGYNIGRSAAAGYDLAFMNNYLKSNYISDGLITYTPATGVTDGPFDGLSLTLGTIYAEQYPDNISVFGGGIQILTYSAPNTTAGVAYKGLFGAGTVPGTLVYVTFGLENISETDMSSFMGKAIKYFYPTLGVNDLVLGDKNQIIIYPNPFLSEIKINLNEQQNEKVTVRLFDLNGKIVLQTSNAGGGIPANQIVMKTENLSNGIYFCEVKQADGKVKVSKVIKN